MKFIRKKKAALMVVFGIIVLFSIGYIYSSNRQEENVENEEERKMEYINCLKELGVYSEDGSNFGIDNILFEAKKINGMYIREGDLQVWLRTMYLINDSEDKLTVEEIYSLYEEENPEIQKKFDFLMEYLYDGGREDGREYIKEIGIAYDAYLNITGEMYNGKEKNRLTIEDCVGLEEWIVANPDSEKYPYILKWYGVK